MIESIVLLQVLGGECPEDIQLIAGDACLERGLGYAPPKPTAVREFLERFHDKELERCVRPGRRRRVSFSPPAGR